MAKERRFKVIIAADECKACERCVNACPRGVLVMGDKLNLMSFPAVTHSGNRCIGCGICFYACPEPGALTVVEEIPDEGEEMT
jgi:NAD-dependent dihydropyrimidine dehydrogenase PreA subunit